MDYYFTETMIINGTLQSAMCLHMYSSVAAESDTETLIDCYFINDSVSQTEGHKLISLVFRTVVCRNHHDLCI